MTVSMERFANTTRTGQQLELPQDGLLRLRATGPGIHLGVEHGTLLVTREGDTDDHVLEAGEQLDLSGPGLVVAWALAPAKVAVSRPATPGPSGPTARAA